MLVLVFFDLLLYLERISTSIKLIFKPYFSLILVQHTVSATIIALYRNLMRGRNSLLSCLLPRSASIIIPQQFRFLTRKDMSYNP